MIYNKPDLAIWNINNKVCTTVAFSYPAVVNIGKKDEDKLNIYCPLIRNLLESCPEYKYEMTSIVLVHWAMSQYV